MVEIMMIGLEGKRCTCIAAVASVIVCIVVVVIIVILCEGMVEVEAARMWRR